MWLAAFCFYCFETAGGCADCLHWPANQSNAAAFKPMYSVHPLSLPKRRRMFTRNFIHCFHATVPGSRGAYFPGVLMTILLMVIRLATLLHPRQLCRACCMHPALSLTAAPETSQRLCTLMAGAVAGQDYHALLQCVQAAYTVLKPLFNDKSLLFNDRSWH